MKVNALIIFRVSKNDCIQGMIRGQFAFGTQICEQLSAWDVVHEEVQIPWVLSESLKADLFEISFVLESYEEGVINVS
jgi:hypothetical protein